MQHILNEVGFLLKKYSTNDPFEIAECLKINILFHNLGNLKGYYTYDRRFRYIVINRDLDKSMQQIICAHELGHDRLHQHFAKYTPLQDTMLYDMSSKPEREANIFAAEILIPDKKIITLFQEYISYGELSAILGMPLDLISFKLQILIKKGYNLNTPWNSKSNFLAF